jgi:adenine-specific DNA-methyltransferase
LAKIITGRQEILSDLEKRVNNKILEQSNFDLLKKLVENADTLDETIKIAELGTTYKRTGFHFDKRLEKQSDTISYFKKNNELSFVQDEKTITHKLIVGDNYPALLNLLVEYKGKVDVIYIDPPYGKDDMGEFADTNYDNAITRDNLLSMLYPRLLVAKQLLNENGVVFCSIDDRNQAYVKCLFDEVFGENNCVGTFIVIRAEGGGLAKQMVIGHDYVHTYAKSIGDFIPLGRPKDIRGKVVEINGEDFWIETDWLRKEFGKYGTCPYDEIEKWHGPKKKQEIEEGLEKGIYCLINKGSQQIVGRYRKVADDTSKFYTILKHLNKNGIYELDELGLSKHFAFPKPVSLIKELILGATIKNKKDSLILDFFAGSGTTGQAVLDLNKNDNGTRQFILATANELTATTPNGIVADVTSKRLKRVMTGKCYDDTSDFEWANNNKPLGGNLLVLDIVEVSNFEAVAGKTAFDVIDETLYGNEKFATVKEKVEWVCDNFEGTQKRVSD